MTLSEGQNFSAGKVSPPSPGGGGETLFLHVFLNGIVSPPSPW